MVVNPSVRYEFPPYELFDKESLESPKTVKDVAIALGFMPQLDGNTRFVENIV